jgi:branched-chain amino acid transport system ATP-binding protein
LDKASVSDAAVTTQPTAEVLRVEALVSGYGNKQVLNGTDLRLARGEVLAVIGHNGAGKSTLLKTVFGLIPIWSGRIVLGGTQIRLPAPLQMLACGVSYLPQGNRVFADLSVRDNLQMGGITLPDRAAVEMAIERVVGQFPLLKARLKQPAGTLSGGERQMLALASSLMTGPRLLLLDEPSLGLSPKMVPETLGRIAALVSDSGASAVIVEQKVREVLRIAHRVCVLRTGRVSFTGNANELLDMAKLKEVYL